MSTPEYLLRFLNLIQPKNYVEFNTTDGKLFSHLQCPCIGIGEHYEIKSSIKIPLKLFRCKTIQFFEKYKLYELLENSTLSCSFIDHAHHFEDVLKNFIELEKASNNLTLVALDNVLPRSGEEASRVRVIDRWMGDVWKIVLVLREYRPDLKIVVIDDRGTGLIFITNLDSQSTTLQDSLNEIIKKYIELPFTSRLSLENALNTVSIGSVEEKSFFKSMQTLNLSEIKLLDWSTLNSSNSSLSHNLQSIKILYEEENKPSMVKRNPPMFVDDYSSQGWANNLLKEVEIDLDRDFCLSVLNARLIGFRSIITEDNLFLNDQKILDKKEQLKLMKKLCNVIETVPSRNVLDEFTDFSCIDERFYSKRIDYTDCLIDDPTILISSQEPTNYGSWLFRHIPKFRLIQKLGLQDLKVLTYASDWQKKWLSLLGVAPENIVHHNPDKVYKFKELIVPALIDSHVYITKETQEFYKCFIKKLGIIQESKTLLYVSRLNQDKHRTRVIRQFLNESEFIDKLIKRGFQIFDPQQHTITEQIRMFASAKIIVGGSGSGMFNCMFAPTGTTIVDIESAPNWLYAHTNLFASLGHNYGLILGEVDASDPAPVHKRWTLNVQKAIQRIDLLL
jgi:Glycosyltransferase 61